ncbi:MAG: T9SS type A sorting domain-containing protein [Prolixibacteraceae bacterium]|nr:T9SS type A sorting domain-containing protein [Prolixibacteraceae bacterium]
MKEIKSKNKRKTRSTKLKLFLIAIFTAALSQNCWADVTMNFDDWIDGSYGDVSTYNDGNGGQWESYASMCHTTNARSGRAVRFYFDQGATEYLLYKGTDGFGKDTGLGTVSFWYRHWSGGGETIRFLVQYNPDGGGWTKIGDTITVTSTTYMEFSEDVNIIGNNILFRIISIDDEERLLIDDLFLEDHSGGATISCSESTLSGFYYAQGYGPSESQSFDVSGSGLTDDITITPSTNYEISDDDASFQSTAMVLTQSGGTVASTTIYTRLKSGLSENDYEETITCSSTGASNETIDCSGKVFPAALENLVINEIDADTRGTDREEFIELYDGGAGNTSLTGLVLVFFNGDGDISYDAYDMDGETTDANGFYVIGSSRVLNVDSAITSSGWLQNGADAVALYVGDDTDFPDDSPLTSTNLIDAVVYGTNDADDAGLLVLLNASQPQVNEDDSGNGVDYSQQRMGNDPGGQRDTDGFQNAWPTPGEANYDAIWLGDTDNDWATATNWSPQSKPGAADKVFILGNAPEYPEVSSAETVDHIVLDHDAQLNGQENLTVTTVEIVHEITFSADTSRWQYFASPFTDLTPAGMASTNNRVDLWMATYNNSIAGDINNAWEFNLTNASVLSPGKGYAICTVNDDSEAGDQIYDTDYFMYSGGTLVDAGSAVTFSLLADESNWNLIGNPFLAPIDWDDEVNIDHSNLQGETAYLYDPSTGTYSTYTPGGGGGSPQHIPPMQGFFVNASSAGDFDIPPGARVNTAAAFLKSEGLKEFITFGVTADSIVDKASLVINPEATNSFDKLDALKLFATNKLLPQVYSTAGDYSKLVVNQLNELPASIQMYLFTGQADEITLSFPDIEKLRNNLEILVELQGKTYDLRNLLTGDIKIPVSEKGITIPFEVHLFESHTGISSFDENNPKVYYNGTGLRYMNFPGQPGHISIFTPTGRKMIKFPVKNSDGYLELNLQQGIYLVFFESSSKTSTSKFIVSR